MGCQQRKGKIGGRAAKHIRKNDNTSALVEPLGCIRKTANGFRHLVGHVNADRAAIALLPKNKFCGAQHGRAVIGMRNQNNANLSLLVFVRHDNLTQQNVPAFLAKFKVPMLQKSRIISLPQRL